MPDKCLRGDVIYQFITGHSTEIACRFQRQFTVVSEFYDDFLSEGEQDDCG